MEEFVFKENKMQQDMNITKYTFKFGVAYCAGVVILGVIFNLFNLDQNVGASIAVLFAAASTSATNFIKDNKRVPNKAEKTKLVWLSLFTAWLVSIMLIISVAFAIDGFGGVVGLIKLATEIDMPVIIGAILFVSLIHLVILSYSYGSLAKKQYDGLLKKGKI